LPPIDVRRSSIEDSQTATERAVKEAGYLKNDSGDRTKRESPQVSDEALYMTDLPTILGNRLVLRLGITLPRTPGDGASCTSTLIRFRDDHGIWSDLV